MTQAKTREPLLEELARRVGRTTDRECRKTLKRAGNNKAVLAPIASKLVIKLRASWSEFDAACEGKNPHEVMMDVLTTYVIPAHQKYSDQREDKRVDYYIGDLQLTR